MVNTLPIIDKETLDDVRHDPQQFIMLIAAEYQKMLAADSSGELAERFTAEQNILVAFQILDEQVSNGGYLQLIENGYGSYIFDTPLSEYLADWGAERLSLNINKARVIYHQKKEVLERKKTLEEFAKLYQEHRDFESVELEYNTIIDSERTVIMNYIDSYRTLFIANNGIN